MKTCRVFFNTSNKKTFRKNLFILQKPAASGNLKMDN